MKTTGKKDEATTITKVEWVDFYRVQQSGHMNMMGHWNVLKFMPDGNWQKAFDHFEEGENDTPLVISETKEEVQV